MNSSPSEITITLSGTTNSLTIGERIGYSDNVYSSLFSSIFSTNLDTGTTPTITVSSGLTNITSPSTSTIILVVDHCFVLNENISICFKLMIV